jgi:hypothetical protein
MTISFYGNFPLDTSILSKSSAKALSFTAMLTIQLVLLHYVISPYVIKNHSSCGGPAKNQPVIFSIDYKLYYKLCDRGKKCLKLCFTSKFEISQGVDLEHFRKVSHLITPPGLLLSLGHINDCTCECCISRLRHGLPEGLRYWTRTRTGPTPSQTVRVPGTRGSAAGSQKNRRVRRANRGSAGFRRPRAVSFKGGGVHNMITIQKKSHRAH